MIKRIFVYVILLGAVAFLTLKFSSVSSVPAKKRDVSHVSTEEMAKNGDAEAQYQLSVASERQGNYLKAKEWLELAANQGHANAQNNLGSLYFRGQGVEQDYKKALHWYEKASEKNNDTAVNSLALMYQKGMGVDKDERTAIELLEKSSGLGNVDALANLAQAYQKGLGVEKDEEKANELFLEAAEKGQINAQHYMGVRFYQKAQESGDLADYREARSWFTKAAEQGFRNSRVFLGTKILANSPLERPENLIEAGMWLYKADHQGSTMAKEAIQEAKRLCVNSGDGFDAGGCYVSAYSGHQPAMYSVALDYDKGVNLPMDKKKADVWYKKAAMSGYPDAQFGFAIFLDMQSENTSKDMEAYAWFKAALTYPDLDLEKREAAEFGVKSLEKELNFLNLRSAKELSEKFIKKYGFKGN